MFDLLPDLALIFFFGTFLLFAASALVILVTGEPCGEVANSGCRTLP
ncbi:hypothetical protein ILP92_06175 [Maribius pontilimi]|uniref:Uncharacterized protein n=1 Tax=Palleronia pontilimi TaxID=1964209 RepID=A0A934IGD5_9RHOB|nr:hypothetical protein [Palleronia pontilimi]MBJ3762326.1 hypothetical protein [Palleronia pontilimi]